MEIFQAFILAIVQGITEWLPVSSSGHLALFQIFFGIDDKLWFNLLVHLSSLLVVLTFFRKDIISIIKSVFTWKKDENFKLGMMVIIGSIPIAVLGFLIKDFVESAFSSLKVIGVSFLVTATLLYLTKNKDTKKELNYKNAFLIGLFQSLAILPGVSRSGSTISGGMLVGVDKNKAARFSFLLFLPAIFGASILEFKELVIPNLAIALTGFVVTFVVSFFVIKYLLNIIREGKFYYFSYYCFILGIITLYIGFR